MWQWEPLERFQLRMSHTEQTRGIEVYWIANCLTDCKTIMGKQTRQLVDCNIVDRG